MFNRNSDIFYIMRLLKNILILGALAVSLSSAAEKIKDSDIVAATLIFEAGGEKNPRKAMEAVYEVIWNRAVSGNKSTSDICLARKQFSCWNGVSDRALKIAIAKKHSRWLIAREIASNPPKTNHTSGARFYHTLAVNPSWKRSMKKTTTIFNHIFYKA